MTVTFDVWGNKSGGLHGYDTIEIEAAGKKLQIYGSESGGYHDDTPHFGNFDSEADKRQHPELYHFPLDVFP